MMDKEKFSRLLLDTQAKYLLERGKHMTNIHRSGHLVALYALGKRFYEIIYNYNGKEVVKIEEVNTEQVMKIYLHQI